MLEIAVHGKAAKGVLAGREFGPLARQGSPCAAQDASARGGVLVEARGEPCPSCWAGRRVV